MAANLGERSLAFQGEKAAFRDAEAYLLHTGSLPLFDSSVPGLIGHQKDSGSRVFWSNYPWMQAARPIDPALAGLAERLSKKAVSKGPGSITDSRPISTDLR